MFPGREGVSDGELPAGVSVSPGENRAELCLVQVGWCSPEPLGAGTHQELVG